MTEHIPSPTGARVTPAQDICVIVNPGSGKDDRDVPAEIGAWVDANPGRVTVRVLKPKQDPAEEAARAAREGFATLVAAGGDGTISAVAAVVHEADLRLGVVAAGTFNFFARGLDLPEETGAALDLIASDAERDVPVGEVNGHLFLNNASIGLYPAILAEREGTYRRWGRSRLAAHWSVLTTMMRFHQPLSLRVSIDGREVSRRSPLAFVARSAYQLELLGIEGAEDVRAGRFALFLAPDTGRWGLLLFALRLAWRSMERGRDFEYHTGREITVETRAKRRLVARDGERDKLGQPFVFRMLDRPLRVAAGPEAR
jgi:diacylglycerol kinase family enzyme